jgi:hypothetical protein
VYIQETTTMPSSGIFASAAVTQLVYPIHPGDTVSKVVAKYLPKPDGTSETIVLIRHGPEGVSKRLIQISPSGRLMDPTQDVALRDGDELDFPPAATNP